MASRGALLLLLCGARVARAQQSAAELTQEQVDQYARDGVLLVKGLLTPQELMLAQQTAAELLDAKQRFFPRYRLVEFQSWRTNPSFRAIAFDSAAPAMAAQLMGLRENTAGSSPPFRAVRLLKDTFLAMESGDTGCGWHIDDKIFWPTLDSQDLAANDEGINVWITLSSHDEKTGGGLAVAPGSHRAEYREECRKAIAGAMGGGEGPPRTCDLEDAHPRCHAQMESIKMLHAMEPGDALLTSRYIFHRGEPFQGGEPKLRLAIRYMPEDAQFFETGFANEAAATVKGLKHGDAISDASEYFPQVWPDSIPGERALAESGKVERDPTLSFRPPPEVPTPSCDQQPTNGPGGYERRRRLRSAQAVSSAQAVPRAPWLDSAWLDSAEGAAGAAGAARWQGSAPPWSAEWRQRVACWWAALPTLTRTQLGSCFGALALHIGSRLDGSWRAAQSLLGHQPAANPTANPATNPAADVAAEPGCEWIAEQGGLSLPEAPPFPSSLDFRLPPIPRLLPSYQYLQSLAPPRNQHGGEATPAAKGEASPRLAMGLGVGMLAGVLLIVGVSRRRAR